MANQNHKFNSYAGYERVSCDVSPWYYGLGMAFLVVSVPLTPDLFGITALFLRSSLMAAGGLIIESFMTNASEHLAMRSFVERLEQNLLEAEVIESFDFCGTP